MPYKEEYQKHEKHYREYQREWRKRNKQYSTEYRRQHPEQTEIDNKKGKMIQRFGSAEQYEKAIGKNEGHCALCNSKATEVHHVDGRSTRSLSPIQRKEINNDLNNLLPVCKPCHGWLHRTKQLSYLGLARKEE